jgi:hypothetical protein
MTNKTKELVAAGHALAKELHCAESAALVRELATQLDVQMARSNALAAENAGLKKFCKDAAFDADYEAELGMERGGFTDALNDIKTPATDAFLTEVRASGVEMFADSLGSPYVERGEECYQDGYTHAIERIKSHKAPEFAAQLRKGVQS